MKTIGTIIETIVSIALIGAIIVGIIGAYNVLTNAEKFANMNAIERGYTYVTDRDSYEDMEKSFNLVASICEFMN